MLLLFAGKVNFSLKKKNVEKAYTYISRNAYVASCLQNGTIIGYNCGRTIVEVYADKKLNEKVQEYKIIVFPWNNNKFPLFVNRWNGVPEDKIPCDLVEIPAGTPNYNIHKSLLICKVAAEAYDRMSAVANAQGIFFKITHAYRSCFDQAALIEESIKTRGKEKTMATAAPVGFSEHHTGLAIDVSGAVRENGTFITANEEVYKWLADNCYRYGFMIKNLKGKEHITGTVYEPWHIRYIGDTNVTKLLHDYNFTLDEYIEIKSME